MLKELSQKQLEFNATHMKLFDNFPNLSQTEKASLFAELSLRYSQYMELFEASAGTAKLKHKNIHHILNAFFFSWQAIMELNYEKYTNEQKTDFNQAIHFVAEGKFALVEAAKKTGIHSTNKELFQKFVSSLNDLIVNTLRQMSTSAAYANTNIESKKAAENFSLIAHSLLEIPVGWIFPSGLLIESTLFIAGCIIAKLAAQFNYSLHFNAAKPKNIDPWDALIKECGIPDIVSSQMFRHILNQTKSAEQTLTKFIETAEQLGLAKKNDAKCLKQTTASFGDRQMAVAALSRVFDLCLLRLFFSPGMFLTWFLRALKYALAPRLPSTTPPAEHPLSKEFQEISSWQKKLLTTLLSANVGAVKELLENTDFISLFMVNKEGSNGLAYFVMHDIQAENCVKMEIIKLLLDYAEKTGQSDKTENIKASLKQLEIAEAICRTNIEKINSFLQANKSFDWSFLHEKGPYAIQTLFSNSQSDVMDKYKVAEILLNHAQKTGQEEIRKDLEDLLLSFHCTPAKQLKIIEENATSTIAVNPMSYWSSLAKQIAQMDEQKCEQDAKQQLPETEIETVNIV